MYTTKVNKNNKIDKFELERMEWWKYKIIDKKYWWNI